MPPTDIPPAMYYLFGSLVGLMLISIVVMAFAIRNQRRRNRRMRNRFRDFEGEEERMFCFLHDL